MAREQDTAAHRVGQVYGGRWQLEQLLGCGGMAAVYRARDASGNLAAIKILHPEVSVEPGVRERFVREAYVSNRVAHPGAVRVLEHGTGPEGSAYLALELLEGEPLSGRIRRLGGLSLADLLDYLDQVLDVLAKAHAQGIIHRDLKPDNLFVTHTGQIKVLDFGLARLEDSAPGDYKTRTGIALGTLPYMAPEQALGRRAELDGRCDLFALGATSFRILTGRKVHEAESDAELLMAMASKPAPPLASVAPHVPADVCKVVDIALAFAKEARYPNAAAMQSDVRALREGLPPPYAQRFAGAREEATRIDRTAPMVPAAVPARAAAARALPLAENGTAVLPAAQHSFGSQSTIAAPAPVVAAGAGAPALPVTPPLTASRKSRVALGIGLGVLALLGTGAAALAFVLLKGSEQTAAPALTTPTAEHAATSGVAAPSGLAEPAANAAEGPAEGRTPQLPAKSGAPTTARTASAASKTAAERRTTHDSAAAPPSPAATEPRSATPSAPAPAGATPQGTFTAAGAAPAAPTAENPPAATAAPPTAAPAAPPATTTAAPPAPPPAPPSNAGNPAPGPPSTPADTPGAGRSRSEKADKKPKRGRGDR